MIRRSVVTAFSVRAFGSRVTAADAPGATVETGGVTIWYEVRGSGPGTTLIVANGGPGFDHNHLLCGNAWDTIARGRKIVFYDQRGNTRSSDRCSPTRENRATPSWRARHRSSAGRRSTRLSGTTSSASI